jgi:hypothetical protein
MAAQQDPNDLGEADSVYVEIYQPAPGVNEALINVEVYLLNDVQNLKSVSSIYTWDNPSLVFDSMKWSPQAAFAFAVPEIFDPLNPVEVNSFRQFPFVGLDNSSPGWTYSSTPHLAATCYFHLENWSEGDSVCIDTTASYLFVFEDQPGVSYVPVWRGSTCFYNNPTGVEETPSGELPSSFGLSQNYPNPFNPSTRIEYRLSARAGVKLEVINLLGQRVATLVNDVKPAGTYTASWNGTGASGQRVASGFYYYRLTAGDYVQTRKMLLLK